MKLADLDLNLLVPLEALLIEQNISRAAVRAGVSQSAMSKTLSRLRTTFGDDLLIRAGQEYCLSPFAEGLVPELEEALATLGRVLGRRPTFDPATDRHVFKIAAIDALEYLIIKPLVDHLSLEGPGVALEIHAVEGEATRDMLRNGDIDISLTSIEYTKNDLSQEMLFADRRVCAVWRGVPGIGEQLTYEQLMTLPHAAYDWAGFDVLSGEYAEWEYMDKVPVRLVDVRLLMRLFMLRGTSLVTFAWESMARAVADIADIRVVEPPFEPTFTAHRMIWHPRDTSDPAHAWLRQQIRSIVDSLDVDRSPAMPSAEVLA